MNDLVKVEMEEVRDEDEDNNQDDKFFTRTVKVFIVLFAVWLCCIGGLLFQYETEIKTFFSGMEQTIIDMYVNSPPFVKGFLLTAAIIIGLVLLIGLLVLFLIAN